MRIALTGATGFIGRYIAAHLAAQGHRLRCWYRHTSDRSGFEHLARSLEWVEGDLGARPRAATWSKAAMPRSMPRFIIPGAASAAGRGTSWTSSRRTWWVRSA